MSEMGGDEKEQVNSQSTSEQNAAPRTSAKQNEPSRSGERTESPDVNNRQGRTDTGMNAEVRSDRKQELRKPNQNVTSDGETSQPAP